MIIWKAIAIIRTWIVNLLMLILGLKIIDSIGNLSWPLVIMNDIVFVKTFLILTKLFFRISTILWLIFCKRRQILISLKLLSLISHERRWILIIFFLTFRGLNSNDFMSLFSLIFWNLSIIYFMFLSFVYYCLTLIFICLSQ